MNEFSNSLRKKKNDGKIPVVVDFKCISPGDEKSEESGGKPHGRLLYPEDAVRYAKAFEAAGVPAISVVTEKENFGGSLEMLKSVTEAVSIPVLRKDFIRTKEEIDISIEYGAKAVLLMCAVMSKEDMRICYSYAIEKGIEPLVETHNPEEMKQAQELGAKLVGINNRNILKLETDDGTVSTTQSLLGTVKNKYADAPFIISESGILTAEDVRNAIGSGADSVLVGTAIWKSEDPVGCYNRFAGCC